MDLATAAVELYALLPGEFTAARNKQAKELGRSGDKELAKQVRQLPKPSTSAWLVNMLVAHRREEIDEVLELGASLRQAQEDLDQKQLKELTDQRHRLLASVVKDGRELAEELGQKASESVASEVEQTLRAAMADTDAADAVASGQLSRSLSSTGWEPVDLSGAVAVPEAVGRTAVAPKPSKKKGAAKGKAKEPSQEDGQDKQSDRNTGSAKKTERDDGKAAEAKEQGRRKEQAQAELEEAERRVEEAESEQEETEKRYEEAVSRQEQLEAEIAELKKQLRKLERNSKDADREFGSLEDEKDDAVRAAKDARREAGRARRRLNDVQ
ncbi:hypothetical protein [Arthrobacter monumenti]